MGRRRRRRKFKLKFNKPAPETTIAIIFILTGLLATFSIFGLTRSILNGFADQLRELLGWGIFIFPLLSFAVGIFLLGYEILGINLRLIIGGFLILCTLLALTSYFSPNSAGLIGTFIAETLKQIFTGIGTFIILILAAFILIPFTLQISLRQWIETSSVNLSEIILFLKEIFVDRVIDWLKSKQEEAAVDEVELSDDQEQDAAAQSTPKIEIEISDTDEDSPDANQFSEKSQQSYDESIELEEDWLEDISDDLDSDKKRDDTVTDEWTFPPLTLLTDSYETSADRGDIEKNAQVITQTLESFGINAKVAEVNLGPSVTQYALEIAEGTKISRVIALQNDLALALATPTGTVRIEAPIPGKSLIGVEVPNYSPSFVSLLSVLKSESMQKASSNKTVVPLGHNVAGKTIIANIAKWPHVLIAGATGSGKSVLLHSIVTTLLFRNSPDELKMILVDPKRVELTQYDGLPHLLTPVIVQVEKVVAALKWTVAEMEHRYEKFQNAKARDIASYNDKQADKPLPYIMVIVDELADIMAFAANEVEGLICRIAQMSRATGIHLILSTQRPSVDVLTGLIKANIPTRIALNVSSGTDSRVIIDTTGAEKLLGKGDMLYLPPDLAKPVRVQGVYVSPEEIKKLIDFLQTQNSTFEEVIDSPELDAEKGSDVTSFGAMEPDDEKDPLFKEAARVILNHKRASASLLQRRLSIGYARAARILDELEAMAMVSPKDGSKPRDVFAEKVRAYLNNSQNTHRNDL